MTDFLIVNLFFWNVCSFNCLVNQTPIFCVDCSKFSLCFNDMNVIVIFQTMTSKLKKTFNEHLCWVRICCVNSHLLHTQQRLFRNWQMYGKHFYRMFFPTTDIFSYTWIEMKRCVLHKYNNIIHGLFVSFKCLCR